MSRTLGGRMIPVAAALASLVFAACESSTDPDVAAGEFEITIAGDLEGSTTGEAVHGSTSDGSDDTWTIMMTATDGAEDFYVFLVRYGSRPPTGEFTVLDAYESDTYGPGDWVAFVTVVEDGLTSIIGYATSGTIEITSSSTEQLAGTFDLDVYGFDPDAPSTEYTFTVSGSFNAESGIIL